MVEPQGGCHKVLAVHVPANGECTVCSARAAHWCAVVYAV